MTVDKVFEMAEMLGGKVEEVGGPLPDGSGFAVMSMPLKKDHWIYEKAEDGFSLPPSMPLRMGSEETILIQIGDRPLRVLSRHEFSNLLREAGKHAVRGATMGGTEMDFDPDALLQNLVVGALGYWTADGLSSDDWANPKTIS